MGSGIARVCLRRRQNGGFQFIEFPSEWGEMAKFSKETEVPCFQFIEFPSEWGEELPNGFFALPVEFPIY